MQINTPEGGQTFGVTRTVLKSTILGDIGSAIGNGLYDLIHDDDQYLESTYFD